MSQDEESEARLGVVFFAERYADQNERDYQAFAQAIRCGRLHALEGV